MAKLKYMATNNIITACSNSYIGFLRPLISFFLLLLFLINPLAGLAQTPYWPSSPTLEDCRHFENEIWTQLSIIYKRRNKCMRDTSPDIQVVMECNSLTGTMRMSTAAWPHCFQESAAKECELIEQRLSAPQCHKLALKDRPEASDSYNTIKIAELENTIKRTLSDYQSTKNAFDDPKVFIKEWLAEHLVDKSLKDLTRDDNLTPYGKSSMQQVYDYLFGKSLGNASFYSRNPIISAIQGDISAQIKLAHDSSLNHMEMLTLTIDSFSSEHHNNGADYKIGQTKSEKRSHSLDCDILDGHMRIDLSINDPERYEQLVNKCREN
ncbi:hypothetical protein [Stutzerimonas frequens]|uniref:hypothetical protein n=1 Tax=Stutzerimonas frequens TaxID=2968969 RepID=UPI0022DE5DED|nr:hypothetical protein [Stutzerimonas frequens]MDA0426055.1 hypothetical protein [Stutzerimonas frequens]